MVQKTAKRGRPPKFDRNDVIAAAVDAFFRSGYDRTTLADLEAATGVDRSTLYNSFGGKQGLYELATGAYLDTAQRCLFEPLDDQARDGYEAIIDFLHRLRSGLTAPEASPGCLIVNDMAAGSAPKAAADYYRGLERGLMAALARAGHPTPEVHASTLATAVLGINLVAKSIGDAAEIRRLVDAVIVMVTTWQEA